MNRPTIYPGDRNPRRRASPIRPILVALTLLALCGAPAVAAQTAIDDSLAAVRAEIEALKTHYERRISELEARIAELEAERGPGQGRVAPEPTPEADRQSELDALREAARQAAGGPAVPMPPAAETQPAAPTFGRERNLNRLNPEISMTGNVLGFVSDAARDEFRVQEFELDIQSALDPFSTTHWTLAVSDEGVEIEEGYVNYPSLWRGLGVTVGKFRQSFGVLNRYHLHALPQVEYPLALQEYLGEEGLSQTGLGLSWVLPRGWADTNTLTFQVTDGSAEVFGGEDFQQLAYLGRLTNYWDLSPATYLELGLSGVEGDTAQGGTARILGADLTLDWAPPGRSKYREVVWRTELLRSERDDPFGVRQEAWGGYSYLEGLLARNLWAGVRYDRVEDPLDPSHVKEALVPYITWWQSEFVRLRGQYRFFDDTDADENSFVLQLTWAAGPHKHETY